MSGDTGSGCQGPADVWIDLSNSPHIPFFVPIVEELQSRGLTVVLTARDFAQTRQLALRAFGDVSVIGGWGRGMTAKTSAIGTRAVALARFARRRRFRLAVSHNSYAQILAARLVGVPVVTLMDYEHQPANHVAFRLARLVMVPEVFPQDALHRYGARRVLRYPGLKEHVYLRCLDPRDDLRDRLGVADRVLAVLRPPPDAAAYHQFENPLFASAVDRILGCSECTALLLPRTPAQEAWARQRWGNRIMIPDCVLPGEDLLMAADLVVGAGGTMSREAALLGTPSFSLFAGRPSAVDQHLAEKGLLTFVRTEADLEGLVISRKPIASPVETDSGAHPSLDAIVSGLVGMLNDR